MQKRKTLKTHITSYLKSVKNPAPLDKITERVSQKSGTTQKANSVYITLKRMGQEGLINKKAIKSANARFGYTLAA